TIHQHFNADAARPARLISCTNRIYKNCGLNDLEQIEDAPEYDPNVVLAAELVKDYLALRTREPARGRPSQWRCTLNAASAPTGAAARAFVPHATACRRR